MNKKEIIRQTERFVREKLEGEGTGHDFFHIERVWKMAVKIGREEKADLFVVELAALLHDVADPKLNNGDEQVGLKIVRDFLAHLAVEPAVAEHVLSIIGSMSFSKNVAGRAAFDSRELRVVQDADWLDAVGAIGIARAFAYGGSKGRVIYDPKEKPKIFKSTAEYRRGTGTTVNHLYEKSMKLKGMLTTNAARKIAEKREAFTQKFLDQFLAEWDGRA